MSGATVTTSSEARTRPNSDPKPRIATSVSSSLSGCVSALFHPAGHRVRELGQGWPHVSGSVEVRIPVFMVCHPFGE